MNTPEKSIGSPRRRTLSKFAAVVYAITSLVAAACGDTYNTTVVNRGSDNDNNGDEQGEATEADAYSGENAPDAGTGGAPGVDSDRDGFLDGEEVCDFAWDERGPDGRPLDSDRDGIPNACDLNDENPTPTPTSDEGGAELAPDAGVVTSVDATVAEPDLGVDSGLAAVDGSTTDEICDDGIDNNNDGMVDGTPCREEE